MINFPVRLSREWNYVEGEFYATARLEEKGGEGGAFLTLWLRGGRHLFGGGRLSEVGRLFEEIRYFMLWKHHFSYFKIL